MIPNTMLALVDKLAEDGRVTGEEALQVRRAVFPDGTVTRGEAEALFILNERVSGDDVAWNACFVEAIGDHLTLATEPQGHVSDEGAAWLESRIARDGVLEGPTELDLVLKLLERADSVPARLQELARSYVTRAVLTGKGYEGRDIALVPGQIGDAELAMIKNVLYASGGAGDLSVTREEAEWLFDLDAATEGRAHVSGWRDVFVSAIMNHLFAAGPSALMDRGDMLRRQSWLRERGKAGGLSWFLKGALQGLRRGDAEFAREKDFDYTAANEHHRNRIVETMVADALTTPEAAWLVTRIRADGRRTANEQALADAVNAAKNADVLKSA
jgi:hypothetical protein